MVHVTATQALWCTL